MSDPAQSPQEAGNSDALELEKFVRTAREAFTEVGGIKNPQWIADDRPPVVPNVTIKRLTVNQGNPVFTVAEVAQPVGVVIPPHRHNEGHVLLRVIAGTIQVDCEGYSRRIDKSGECLIPQGFTHTVFALASGDAAAVYQSAHYEELLSVDDNRFLSTWPVHEPKEHMSEIQVVRRLITWFLSLHPEYLRKSRDYKAWFYILHTDPDSDTPDVDQTGFAGDWTNMEQNLKGIQTRTNEAEGFRLGVLLKQKDWSKVPFYHSLFVASAEESSARSISSFYAHKDTAYSGKWVFKHPSNNDAEAFLKGEQEREPFQEYMRLLTEDFMPTTKFIVYLTPPQCPEKQGYLDDVQRMPFSSLILGLTHADREFVAPLQTFFLLCSSVLQQVRFAVRSDVVKIRYNEDHRLDFFKDRFLKELKEVSKP